MSIGQPSKDLLAKSCVCRHSDEERMLHGAWCTPELTKAVELGYIIVTIHEVWHFNERRMGLFSDQVNVELFLGKVWRKLGQVCRDYR